MHKEERGDPEKGMLKRLLCDLSVWFWSIIWPQALCPWPFLRSRPLQEGSCWFLTLVFDAWSTLRIFSSSHEATYNSQHFAHRCRELPDLLKFTCGPLRGLWVSVRFWSMWSMCAVFSRKERHGQSQHSLSQATLTVQMVVPAWTHVARWSPLQHWEWVAATEKFSCQSLTGVSKKAICGGAKTCHIIKPSHTQRNPNTHL